MKNNKGFTMTELVITLIIVAIMSIIAVVIYSGMTKRAIVSEALIALETIRNEQEISFQTTGNFLTTGNIAQTPFNAASGIDMRQNKWFGTFSLTTNANTYTGTVYGTAGTKAANITGTVEGTKADTDDHTTITVRDGAQILFSR